MGMQSAKTIVKKIMKKHRAGGIAQAVEARFKDTVIGLWTWHWNKQM